MDDIFKAGILVWDEIMEEAYQASYRSLFPNKELMAYECGFKGKKGNMIEMPFDEIIPMKGKSQEERERIKRRLEIFLTLRKVRDTAMACLN